MSKLEVAGEAGNVAANLIKDAAGGEGMLADAARAAQHLLDDAGGAVGSRPKTLSLSGDALAAAKERIAEGGIMRRRPARAGIAQGTADDAEVFAKPPGVEGEPGRRGGITSWRAPEGAPNPFHGDPIKVTADSGLTGIESAATKPAAAVKAERVPPPPRREPTLEERLPTKAFEEEREPKNVSKLPDGTVVTQYNTEIPFRFTNSRGFPLTGGEYVTTVAQHDAGAMKGWTTLHNPDGIDKIGIGPENGSNYLGKTSPVLALNFQPKDFANKFSHLEGTGAPAFIRGDTTFLRTEANGPDKPVMAFVNPTGELAGLQWNSSRVMQHGPFAGLKGDEINVIDGKMRLVDHSEMVGAKPKEYIYDPKSLGMENIQTWSVVPNAVAHPDKAIPIAGVEDKVIVPQLLYPRPLMNIVEGTKPVAT
jgi:hypothetical protein